MEADSLPSVGSGRRGLGGDRGALPLHHLAHWFAVGQGHLGCVLDLGCPTHHHRPAVGAVPWLPRAEEHRRRPEVRAKRAAIAGLVAAADIPIVNQAINWWRTLHQGRTFRVLGEATIDGLMLFSLFVSMVAFALLYVWLMIHRLRVAQMEDILEAKGLEVAIAERMAEAEPVEAQ